MTGPTLKERNQVRLLKDISMQDRQRLTLIFKALGLGSKEQARLMRKTLKQTELIMSGELPLHGGLLGLICHDLSLKIDVVRGKRNFDYGATPTSSTWQGPPRFFINGDKAYGKHLKKMLSCLSELSVVSEIDPAVFTGDAPVTVGMVRKVHAAYVMTARNQAPDSSSAIATLLDTLPERVCTVENLILPSLLREVSQNVWDAVRAQYELPSTPNEDIV